MTRINYRIILPVFKDELKGGRQGMHSASLESVFNGKKILVASHRGVVGGNIVNNTIEAYEVALRQGADIIEVDVVKTTDDVFYTFHEGKEACYLGLSRALRSMDSAEVDALHYVNLDGQRIGEGVNRLDDVLEHFKSRCLINIDRSWDYWDTLLPRLERHAMGDQIILKSRPEKAYLERLADWNYPFMYMGIVEERSELIDEIKLRNINLVCLELIFMSDGSPLVSPRLIQKLQAEKLHLWANAINFDDSTILAGQHDDMTSVLGNPEDGWGWLVDRGFDIIHTDWPLMLNQYLEKKLA